MNAMFLFFSLTAVHCLGADVCPAGASCGTQGTDPHDPDAYFDDDTSLLQQSSQQSSVSGKPYANTTTVRTECGPVRGSVEFGGDITSWKGIPFAAPPLGHLRWRPPRPNACWNGTLNADKFANMCPQERWKGALEIVGNEDCLFLNVFARRPAANLPLIISVDEGGPPLPVLVYIHGGSLVAGDGRTNFTDFMRHGCKGGGCVVVTIQYRLDILGWLASSALSHEQGGVSGNYGIMDMQLALQWVQDNIGAFGGDKNRVTLMGQSSGGTGIFALLGSPKSKGLFHGAVSMSGSPNVTMDLAAAEKQNQDVTIGCSGADRKELMKCMRALDVEKILWSRPTCWIESMFHLPRTVAEWKSRGAACGLPIVDGVTITKPIMSSLEDNMMDVPLLFGNIGWEGGEAIGNISEVAWGKYLADTFAHFGPSFGQKVAAEFIEDSSISSQKAYAAITATWGLTCASPQLARAAFKGNRTAPIYTFVNDWSPGGMTTAAGILQWAYHCWDFMVVLENWPANYFPVAGDISHARFLQHAIYNLMSTASLDPALNYGWLPVNAVEGWPVEYNTMLMQDPFTTAPGPAMAKSYKSSTCKLFEGAGIGMNYWWIN